MQRHILIVDDEPNFRFSTELALKRKGFRVSQAGDGKEALDSILNAERNPPPFDLILMDMELPTLSGTEIIQQMHEKGIRTPIMVVSGSIDTDLYNGLTRLGCLSIYFKPVSEKILLARISELLQGTKTIVPGCR